jgi:hypothetical protein
MFTEAPDGRVAITCISIGMICAPNPWFAPELTVLQLLDGFPLASSG